MKKTWIVLLIICVTIFFTFSIKGNAAELYGTEVYLMQEVWDGNTGKQETSLSGFKQIWSLTSSSPIYVYHYAPDMAPSSTLTDYCICAISRSEIAYDSSPVENISFTDTNGDIWYLYYSGSSTSYAYPYYAYLSFDIGSLYESFELNKFYNADDFITDYINSTLDYTVEIDWNNPVYNDSIGYLQNVGLKITGVGGNDFTLTWAVENSEYLSEDYRVQIGYMTNFTRELLGEQKAYTNMDLITWEDALYYSVGRKEFKLKELWDMIPDAISYSHSGYFLLRLVHVDEETGLYEVGGWKQIHYIIDIDGKDTVSWANIKSSSILEHNGVTDNYEIIFEEDTTSGKGGFINSANGSIDSVSTNIQEFTKDWDLSKVGDYFSTGITSLGNSLSQFPSMVSEVASFLPPEIIAIIGLSIIAVIICRFAGR